MTDSRCAYCDGGVGAQSLVNIDHFRPKSKFRHLAFAWDNLLPACQGCNTAKRDQYADGLLRPDVLDYNFPAYFRCNFSKGTLEPNAAKGSVDYERALLTIEILDLNRPALSKDRLRQLEHWEKAVNPEIADYPYRDFLEASR